MNNSDQQNSPLDPPSEIKPGSLTILLRDVVEGRASEQSLYEQVEAHLKQRSCELLKTQSPRIQPLQQTELVDEAFMRLIRSGSRNWNDRKHFFSAATTTMRRMLVTHFKKEVAMRRGGYLRTETIHEGIEDPKQNWAAQLVELDDLLTPLREKHPLAIEVLEHWAFSGWSQKDIAEFLERTPYQIESLLKLARRLVERQWKRSESAR